MKLRLPLYFYPTKTVFVDDEPDYFEDMIQRLSISESLAEYYLKPFYASEQINKAYFHRKNKESYLKVMEKDELESWGLDIDMSRIREISYNEKRFEEISVVVVDYDMPSMNGIEFCKRIKDPYIKKILLTGVANEEDAIDAFNEGLIDGYIKKQDISSFRKLDQLIKKCQWQYFIDKSESLTELLSSEMLEPLTQEGFDHYFNKTVEAQNIVEFYLCSPTGTYLLLKENGEDSGFWSFTEDYKQFWQEAFSAYKISVSLKNKISKNNNVLLLDTCEFNEIKSETSIKKRIISAEQLYFDKPYLIGLKDRSLVINRKKITSLYQYKKTLLKAC